MVINFNNLMKDIKEKYKIDYRDMAGVYSKDRVKLADQMKKDWAYRNNLGESYERVKASKECRAGLPLYDEYIKIEQGWFKDEGSAFYDELPYLDVWHWLLDNDFEDMENGGTFDLDISMKRIFGSEPEYVRIIFALMRKELEPIDNDVIQCYVSW